MRIILTAVAIAALAWGGYWFIGAAAMERSVTGWLDDRQNDGWQADTTKVETRGFPNRFDTTLSELKLADPKSGIAWTAPFFQILSLSYRPNHIIAVFPNSHQYATPFEKVEITSNDMQGSVVFVPDTSLALDRTSFVGEDLKFVSDQDWSIAANAVRFATRQSATHEMAHDISIEADEVEPGGQWAKLVKDNALPTKLSTVKVDATVGFSQPWDRFALERARPQPTMIDLRTYKIEWGELLFQATGKVDIDSVGIPTGKISVQARNWKEMLKLMVQIGEIPPDALRPIESGLSLLAGMSGNPDHIDASFNLKNGFIAVGPIPIGPAPRLQLR